MISHLQKARDIYDSEMYTMPKYKLALIGMLLLAVAVFSGCGGGSLEPSPNPNPKPPQQPPPLTPGIVSISTATGLKDISKNLAGNYKLTANISLAGSEWVPIGAESAFTGNFDGNGYKITGLTIGKTTGLSIYDVSVTAAVYEDAGLFGNVSGATISNLTLENVYIVGGTHVGAIAGFVTDSTITNCHVSGYIEANAIYPFAGGIAGSMSYSTISKCSNDAAVVSGVYAGGIVGGTHESTIKDCENTGEIYSEFEAGGIAGSASDDTIEGCSNAGMVSAETYAGGIVGSVHIGKIVNNSNAGNVSADSAAGGIVGNSIESTIKDCENTGEIYGGYEVGGIAGSASDDTIEGCSNAGIVNGDNYAGGIAGSVSDVAIVDCSSKGNIFSNGDAGGIVGIAYGFSSIRNCNCSAYVSAKYHAGGIAGTASINTIINTTANGNVHSEEYWTHPVVVRII